MRQYIQIDTIYTQAKFLMQCCLLNNIWEIQKEQGSVNITVQCENVKPQRNLWFTPGLCPVIHQEYPAAWFCSHILQQNWQ